MASRLPQLGSVAQQCGEWTAKNILAEIAGKSRTPFHYHDKGIMAMIGRDAAVAEIGRRGTNSTVPSPSQRGWAYTPC